MHPYHIPHFPPTIVEVKDFPLLFSKIDLLRRRRRFDTGNHRQWLVGCRRQRGNGNLSLVRLLFPLAVSRALE